METNESDGENVLKLNRPQQEKDDNEQDSSESSESDFDLGLGENFEDDEESDFEFDDVPVLDKSKLISAKITKPKAESGNQLNEEDMHDFLDKLDSTSKSVHESTTYEIFCKYEVFLTRLPDSVKPYEIADTLLQPCCAGMCCLKFTPEFVMRTRLRIPTSNSEVINQFQFFLMNVNTNVGGNFLPQINEIPICAEFFQRLYIIPKNRFNSFTSQISLGFTEPLSHGNKGSSYEHQSTSKRASKILDLIDTMAEPHPSDSSYILPAGTTKADTVKRAILGTKVKINPTQEINRLNPTFRFQKANTFTKCSVCVRLKAAIKNPDLTPLQREEAKLHLKNHYGNVKNDRRCASLRHLTSLQEINFLLSLAHDGMSKELSKFPHLTVDNTKKLTDAMKMMCSLNLSVVHRKSLITPYQLHAFWNIDQTSGAKANSVISQLFFTISQCNPIPSNIAIQLDNCASNKCYTLFGAFGMLLIWIPTLTNIYICTSEVGHTHNEVDQKFGILSTALEKEQVFTPQGYVRFVEKKLKGLKTNNLLPTTYDFEQLIKNNVIQNGKIAKNHYFEIFKKENGTVVMRIARFLRSQKYLPSNSDDQSTFEIFKQPPTNEHPKIIAPNALDAAKHNKLCEVLRDVLQPKDFQELRDLPRFIKENYEPESFETLLKRINENVVTQNISVEVPEDPENDLVEEFLQRISKPWDKDGTVSAPSTDHSSITPTSLVASKAADVRNKTPQRLKRKSQVSTTSDQSSTSRAPKKTKK